MRIFNTQLWNQRSISHYTWTAYYVHSNVHSKLYSLLSATSHNLRELEAQFMHEAVVRDSWYSTQSRLIVHTHCGCIVRNSPIAFQVFHSRFHRFYTKLSQNPWHYFQNIVECRLNSSVEVFIVERLTNDYAASVTLQTKRRMPRVSSGDSGDGGAGTNIICLTFHWSSRNSL